ncbi:hypothetical protein EDB80DRAFT_757242 [Ilyonectria destructans]|nr:hypothetical protein EDB80DRAFT_757242 [Ilyonectria destructans]
MVRSSSPEPAETTKRKDISVVWMHHACTRTLTPQQLARKRANDREAQRMMRARTKEHIGWLEREVEELKNKQSQDQTVQGLLHRNKELQDELNRLKNNMGISMASYPYSTPVYDDSLSSGSGATANPGTLSFPSGDYNSLPYYSQQYVSPPNRGESWASTVPYRVPSNVSSPSFSANTDDYNAGYIPTSIPTSMLPSINNSGTNVDALFYGGTKAEYEDVETQGKESHGLTRPKDASYSPYLEAGTWLSNPPMPASHPSSYMQQQ